MAAFAAYIPYVLAAAGTLSQMDAQRIEAKAARDKANYDAAIQQRQGIQAQAESQVAAEEERAKSRELQSRAMAIAAASGAGASDPQVVNRIANIEERGDLNARARLYAGDSEASGRGEQASLLRSEGDQIMAAGKRKQTATLISGASQMAKLYG